MELLSKIGSVGLKVAEGLLKFPRRNLKKNTKFLRKNSTFVEIVTFLFSLDAIYCFLKE